MQQHPAKNKMYITYKGLQLFYFCRTVGKWQVAIVLLHKPVNQASLLENILDGVLNA